MILRKSLVSLILLPAAAVAAQAPSSPASAPAPPAQTALPSAILQPSMDILHTALGAIHADRWKGTTAVRNEAANNLKSIQNDVSTTLPGLLAAADAAPRSTAKVLPAYRNADALYDVLLRVVVAAHLGAPADETSALDQALNSLEDSRRALGDQLQHVAQAQESQIGTLQAALKAVPPPAPAPPPPAPVKCAPAPARKRPAAKPAAKPAATTPQTQSH